MFSVGGALPTITTDLDGSKHCASAIHWSSSAVSVQGLVRMILFDGFSWISYSLRRAQGGDRESVGLIENLLSKWGGCRRIKQPEVNAIITHVRHGPEPVRRPEHASRVYF